MFSLRQFSIPCNRIVKSLRPASLSGAMSLAMTIAVLTAFCLCSANLSSAATCSGQLSPGGSKTTDLLVNGTCTVIGRDRGVGVYVFRNVNIIAGGTLSFEDTRIDFHAENIIVENGGTLRAGRVDHPIGQNPPIPGEVGARVRIYLWGPQNDPNGGALCNQTNCGVPSGLWGSNTTLAMHMVPNPKNSVNGVCGNRASQYGVTLPGNDCFYQYDSFDTGDAGKPAYFGHKVLALSYGGTLQLLGVKGATYDTQVDNTPSNTGQSWVRLAAVSSDSKTLTLSAAVPTWKAGDHIVVTTTDYLPTHNEEVCIDHLQNNSMQVVLGACPAGQPPLPTQLQYLHNATAYALPSNTPASIGPRGSSPRTIETRAAVGLLTRSIEILSDPDDPDVDTTEHDHFPVSAGYFGGHTVVRQGFKDYQVKGVEFYHLGQGGVIGHYPVHFHMARKTADSTHAPYIRDSSIHDSMTRWITVHATQGMIVQRNVGYQSIGHGFYLEDATEVNNKIYGNLGAGVMAAVQQSNGDPSPLNPRKVPGILFRPNDGVVADPFPYRSDWDHPSAFWIMNGWNDFQYNMAAGVTSCGSCYWLVPGADGGPSMFERWDGYASEQLAVNTTTNNVTRAGLAPLQNFVGNSCVAAQFSFVTIGGTYPCLGFSDGVWPGGTTLVGVPNTLAPGVGDPRAAVYYPQTTGLRNPTQCPGGDAGDCSSANLCANDGPDAGKNCMVTALNSYVTSFNYAQTNFAAIWMRAKWFLFTDGAVTDSQYGGLNFTTGGGYTRSDNPYGNWMLAYRSVFIGTSQPIVSNGMPANAYASEAGPFNPTTGLTCDNTSNNSYCLSAANGISMQMGPFPGQRLFSVYDGPAFQDSNAYLDVYPTILTGNPDKWMYLNRYVNGVPKDTTGKCYLPNAAIAWKQPNGFYYPPAFHSQNLMFANKIATPGLIRHFLIEPTFPPLKVPGLHPPDQAIVTGYCSRTDVPSMFNSFTDIDRQTVLNDGVPDVGSVAGGDGSLTGLTATQTTPPATTGRESISVNEDPFFNAPLEHVECASDKHLDSSNGRGKPGTAKTSPYEYVTTAMIAKCAIGSYPGKTLPCPPPDQNLQCPVPKECNQGGYNGPSYWTHQGAGPYTFGVPLYREYLTSTEYSGTPKPTPYFIQMMGQNSGQRSTLTLTHGRYYVDTSNDCKTQQPGGNPPGSNNPSGCLPYQLPSGLPQLDVGVSVFQPGQTYYVYFIYGRASTYLTFDIYLGPNDETGKWAVKPVRSVLNNDDYIFNPVTGSAPWLLTPSYSSSTNLLTVTVDLSKSNIVQEFANEFAKSCQPATYCAVKQQGSEKICGCKKGTACKEEVGAGGKVISACSWGPKDPDCPDAGCYGFSFTMPGDWPGPPTQHVTPPNGVLFTDGDSYFANTNVKWKAINPSQFGQNQQCDYRSK